MTNNLKKTTDPQDELLALVDEANNIIGSIPRGEAHEKGDLFYRTIYIMVKDNKGKYLMQKRSPTKDLYPDCWDISVGGHVNFGESYEETAVREIDEELGVKISEDDLITKGDVLVRLPKSGEHFRVFEYNLKPGVIINASEDEIGDTKWMTIEEIKKSMRDRSLKWYTRPEQVIAALY